VVDGARRAFGEHGYERTSVDQIAAAAGVSKATVYHHFKDKKALFIASFSEEADELREEVRCMLHRAQPEGAVEAALQAVGERLLQLFTAPALVAFYRHVHAEVARIPELGHTVYERGPGALFAGVADYLRRWHERGALRVDDPAAAAVDFVMLCHGDLVVRAQLGALPEPLAPAITATVQRAVRVFLAAHRR
jgi:AcrR family transcriptional regulator